MDENGIFKNEDFSNEVPSSDINAQNHNSATNTENSLNDEPQTFEGSKTSDNGDIELDVDFTNSDVFVDEPNGSKYDGFQTFGEENNNDPIEPISPIMPIIEKTQYTPIDSKTSGKGIKVFAAIIALMVIFSACVTGGYYLGKNSNQIPTVDLASKPEIENALTVSQIYNNVSPSVVGIYVYNYEDGISATATGVVYSQDGYIITNDHIYDNIPAAKFKIYTYDKKMYSAEYLAGDTRSDLAVLKIIDSNGTTFKPAQLGDSKESVVGESVIAIGRPNGATNPSIASEGIISIASTRVSTTSSYTSSLIQTDCAINPGSSGGALCNIYGQVIGITSAKLVGSEYDGVGYAIPTTTVKKVVDSLIKHKTVKNRARLGISYLHIDELTAEISKLPCGLKIAAIDQNSDLYGKSVEINDIITHINGTQITDSNIILDIIDNSLPGDTLNLKIYSVSTKQTVDITVKLLEDKGSSSYTTKKQENNKDNQEYNSSEFSFPNGE